jgi:hypothetical protein
VAFGEDAGGVDHAQHVIVGVLRESSLQKEPADTHLLRVSVGNRWHIARILYAM